MKFSKKTLIMAASMMLCMAMTALGTVAYLTDRAAVANTFTVGNIEIIVDEAVVDQYGQPVESDKKLVDTDGDGVADDEMNESEYKTWVEEQKTANPDKEYPAFADLDNVGNRTTEENQYKIIPGMIYTKDPTMTVMANSEEAYVRMAVTLTNIDKLEKAFGEDFDIQSLVDLTADKWIYDKKEKDEKANTLTYYFNYCDKVYATTTDRKLEPLFTKITLPGTITEKQLDELSEGFKIMIEGHAIQTAAFNEADPVKQAWAAFDEQNNKKQDEGN